MLCILTCTKQVNLDRESFLKIFLNVVINNTPPAFYTIHGWPLISTISINLYYMSPLFLLLTFSNRGVNSSSEVARNFEVDISGIKLVIMRQANSLCKLNLRSWMTWAIGITGLFPDFSSLYHKCRSSLRNSRQAETGYHTQVVTSVQLGHSWS